MGKRRAFLKKWSGTLLFASAFFVVAAANAAHSQTAHRLEAHAHEGATQPAPDAQGNGVTDAPVTPIRVQGPDELVWLVYGEGYTQSDQGNYVSYLHKAFDDIFAVDPLNQFADKINVYAINTVSQTTWTGDVSQDTYFDLRKKSLDNSPILDSRITRKIKVLGDQLLANYLDPGAKVIQNTLLVTSPQISFRSYFMSDVSVVSAEKDEHYFTNVILHEAVHGLGLSDEYADASGETRNNTAHSKELGESAWEPFLGYKWAFRHANARRETNMEPHNGGTASSPRYLPYIPTPLCKCLMLETNSPYREFCPVCEFYVFDRVNRLAGNARDWFWLEPNAELVSGSKQIRFHTVCKNYTGSNQRIKVEIRADQQNPQSAVYSDEFEIPSSGKPHKVAFDATVPTATQSGKIEWRIVDAATGETLQSSSPELIDVAVRFVDESGQSLPETAIEPYVLRLAKGETHAIKLPTIKGYEFVGDPNGTLLPDLAEPKAIALEYRKLASKRLTLNLYADATMVSLLRSVEVEVYENRVFVPTANDFIINFGYGYYALTDVKSVHYDEITETNRAIGYVRAIVPRVEYVGKPVYKVGDDHPDGFWDMVRIVRLNGTGHVQGLGYSFKRWDPAQKAYLYYDGDAPD